MQKTGNLSWASEGYLRPRVIMLEMISHWRPARTRVDTVNGCTVVPCIMTSWTVLTRPV
jgi:hypothetical protein